jgi:hypothetical protein
MTAVKKPLVSIILTLALVLAFTACSNPGTGNQTPGHFGPAGTRLPKAGAVLTGKIIQLYNGSCLIAGSGSSDLYVVPSGLDIYDGNNRAADSSALKRGQNVEIGYAGTVMAIYPAQPSGPAYIKITGQGDDLVGFYQGVLDQLWDTDEGLNSDIDVLAFDLSGVTNLTDAEKAALVYIVSNSHGLQGVTGTFDELSRQGYIDKEKLFFQSGLLFEFKLTDVTGNSFTFDATKWRSGDGADMILDCKAVKNEAGWSYTVGTSAIS